MTKKIAFAFLLIFYLKGVFAQPAVKVTYDVTSLDPGIVDFFKTSLVVIFNDSLVYSYMIYNKSDPMRRRKEAFGEYFMNHATYSHRGLSSFYHTTIKSNRSASTDSSRVTLVSHTYNPTKWTFYSLGKKIYGYDTQTAVSIRQNEKGNSDTTIVWYAPALMSWKNVMGEYAGIEGFPLEIQQQYTDRKLTVEKIEAGDFEISFPRSVEILTHEEFHNRYHENKKGRRRQPSTLSEIISKYY